MNYNAPWWLPGGNLQTIVAAKLSRRYPQEAPVYERERWNTPDFDFIDVDWQRFTSLTPKPLLVLFHGLEGTSRSHYAESFAHYAREHQMDYVVVHFRGCSGELNLAPRAYHSGDYEEIGWALDRLRARHVGPIFAVGISLGGNALLRWAQEAGTQASRTVSAVAAVCSPIDLAASGAAIGKGFNRQVYTRMFMQTMKPKALRKLAQFPGLFDGDALRAARDLYEFDNIFTAPLHGFGNTQRYWREASSKPHLHRIRVPALVLNARNDPFVPAASLPSHQDVGEWVTLWHPQGGGHAGFPTSTPPGEIYALPQAVGGWLRQHCSMPLTA
jgi:predicted alpha/beta-fold hydrolase